MPLLDCIQKLCTDPLHAAAGFARILADCTLIQTHVIPRMHHHVLPVMRPHAQCVLEAE